MDTRGKIKEFMINIIKSHKRIKRHYLNKKIYELGYIISDREMRLIKEEINKEGKILIGSDNKRGYYLVETAEDFDNALHEIESKAYTLLKRRRELIFNFKKNFPEIYSDMQKQARFNFNMTDVIIPDNKMLGGAQ